MVLVAAGETASGAVDITLVTKFGEFNAAPNVVVPQPDQTVDGSRTEETLGEATPASDSPLADAVPTDPNLVKSCGYDFNSGTPNPFGMRSFLTVEEYDDNSTRVIFEYYGTATGDGQFRNSELLLDTTAEQALEMLDNDEAFFQDLVNDSGPEAVKFTDIPIVCESE